MDELDNIEELDNIIVLNDENGNEVRFEFLDLLEYHGKEYVVLFPADDDSDEPGDVVILRVELGDEPDDENYVGVEDKAELDAVFKLFKEKFKDEFNFVDEDESD